MLNMKKGFPQDKDDITIQGLEITANTQRVVIMFY